ncbi:DUF2971 domain-containing protein [Chloroflexota bacterium]
MDNADEIRQEIVKQEKLYASREFDSYFKYFSNDEIVLESIFKRQKIRFTQPLALNDPLEFRPTMHFNDLKQKYQKYKLKGIDFPSTEMFYRVQLIERQINAYGILSLTKIPNSFDMWSHYANGHRGFIVEFKEDFWQQPCMKSEKGEEYPVVKVDYVEDYSLNIEDFVDAENQMPLDVIRNELFLKKTSRWSYEGEYRMIRPFTDCPDYKPPGTRYAHKDLNIYLFPFRWDCIASVCFGACMPSESRMLIARSCEKYNIPLHQAYIIRDHKDSLEKPATVLILSLSNLKSEKEIMLRTRQLFCTDTVSLSNREVVKINKITDLPYYAAHKEVVEEYYRNVKAGIIE